MVGNAVMWALCQSIKVIGVVSAWFLFRAIVENGTGFAKDLIETCEMGLQALGLLLKRKFSERRKGNLIWKNRLRRPRVLSYDRPFSFLYLRR